MSKVLLYTLMFFLTTLSMVAASDKGKEEMDSPAQRLALTPFENPQKQDFFSRDLRRKFYQFMDAPTAVAFHSTCKLLYNDYLAVIKHAENGWFNEGGEHPNFAHILQLMIHSPTLLRVINESQPFEINVLGSSLRPHHRVLLDSTAKSPALCNVLLKEGPALEPGQYFRTHFFIVSILERAPELKQSLVRILEDYQKSYGEWRNNNRLSEELIDPDLIMPSFDQDEGFVNNLRTKTREIQSVLGAASILGASGDNSSLGLSRNFNELLREHMFQDFAGYMIQVPEQPLWVIYASGLEAGNEFCNVLSLINNSGLARASLLNAKGMADYIKGYVLGRDDLLEHHKDTQQDNYTIAMASHCIYESYRGNVNGTIQGERELLEMVKYTQFDQVNRAAYTVLMCAAKIEKILEKDEAVCANYAKTLELIEAALSENAEGKWKTMRLMEKRAALVLLMGDRDRLNLVDDYLEYLAKHGFSDGKKLMVEGSEDPEDEFDEEVSVYRPKLALALYRGDESRALELAGQIQRFKPFILVAMKHALNNGALSEALVEELGSYIAQAFVYHEEEDKDLKEDFLSDKGHALLIKTIFDQAFCGKYLKNQPAAMEKVRAILAKP